MPILVGQSLKAEQLLRRGVSMLFNFMTTNIKQSMSHWVFNTSESASLGVGTPALKFSVGVNGGELFLSRGGTGKTPWDNAPDRVRLGYATIGIGLGLSIPLGGGFSVSASYSSTDWPNTGILFLLPGAHDFTTPDDFNEHGLASPTVIINVDAALLPLRWLMRGMPGLQVAAELLPESAAMDRQIAGSAAAMFLGVNPSLYATLRDIFHNFKDLAHIAFAPPPSGFLANLEDSVTRPAQMFWDLTKIEVEMAMLMARLQSVATMSRAVLFSAGVESALPGVGISAYFGAVRGWTNVGAATPHMVNAVDSHMPKPFTTQ